MITSIASHPSAIYGPVAPEGEDGMFRPGRPAAVDGNDHRLPPHATDGVDGGWPQSSGQTNGFRHPQARPLDSRTGGRRAEKPLRASRNDERLARPHRAMFARNLEVVASFENDERLLKTRVPMETCAGARRVASLADAVRAFALTFDPLEDGLHPAQLVRLSLEREEVLEAFRIAHDAPLARPG